MIPVGDYVSRENEVDHRQAVRVSVGRMMRPQGYSDDTGAASVFLELLDGPRRPWHLQAACCQPDVPTAWFFPDGRGQYNQYKDAKRVCAGCAVIDQCRAEHISEEFGFFFGTAPTQRRRIRGDGKRDNNGGGTAPRHGARLLAVKGKCPCKLCVAWKKQRNQNDYDRRQAKKAAATFADVERLAHAPSAVPGAVSSPFAAPGTSVDLEDAG